MKTTSDKSLKPLREVLYDFALAQDIPNAELLEEYVRLYPQYGVELADFAVDMVVEAHRSAEEVVTSFDESTVSPAVSRAMSAFQVALQEVRCKDDIPSTENVKDAVPVENPFAELGRVEFRGLAESIGANSVFLCKLRDRQIDPETMTEGFLCFLGDKLSVSVDLLKLFFSVKPLQLGGQFFKAVEKPIVGKMQSFVEAVSSSGLTDEQKDTLLSL